VRTNLRVITKFAPSREESRVVAKLQEGHPSPRHAIPAIDLGWAVKLNPRYNALPVGHDIRSRSKQKIIRTTGAS
jgi:hypothetical protein